MQYLCSPIYVYIMNCFSQATIHDRPCNCCNSVVVSPRCLVFTICGVNIAFCLRVRMSDTVEVASVWFQGDLFGVAMSPLYLCSQIEICRQM